MSDAQAYTAGLKMLARRELSEAQLRRRLARRAFAARDIDDAVTRLRQDKALDDRRVALACARTEAALRQRGRARVLRHIESLGIDRDTARAAVAEVFSELDEGLLLEQALEKRLRGGASLADEATARRVHRSLIRQGFDPTRVTAMVESRFGTRESESDAEQDSEPESELESES